MSETKKKSIPKAIQVVHKCKRCGSDKCKTTLVIKRNEYNKIVSKRFEKGCERTEN